MIEDNIIVRGTSECDTCNATATDGTVTSTILASNGSLTINLTILEYDIELIVTCTSLCENGSITNESILSIHLGGE